jgi:hypothetical protein
LAAQHTHRHCAADAAALLETREAQVVVAVVAVRITLLAAQRAAHTQVLAAQAASTLLAKALMSMLAVAVAVTTQAPLMVKTPVSQPTKLVMVVAGSLQPTAQSHSRAAHMVAVVAVAQLTQAALLIKAQGVLVAAALAVIQTTQQQALQTLAVVVEVLGVAAALLAAAALLLLRGGSHNGAFCRA